MKTSANSSKVKHYSLYNSGNPENHEVPAGPRNLDSPQSFLFGASQGFNFYISGLDIIEMELDSFDDARLSSESKPERFDFRQSLSFNRGR